MIHFQSEVYVPFYEDNRGLFHVDFHLDSITSESLIMIMDFTRGKKLPEIVSRLKEFSPEENIRVIRQDPGNQEQEEQVSVPGEIFYSFNISDPGEDFIRFTGTGWNELTDRPALWVVVIPYKIDLMHNLDLLWNMPSSGWQLQTAVYHLTRRVPDVLVLDDNYRFFDFRRVFYFGELAGNSGDVTDLVCVKLSEEEMYDFYDLAFNFLKPECLVLDIGTWMGGSAICFGKACNDRGDGSRVLTIDHKKYPGFDLNLKRSGLSHCITSVTGDVFQVLQNRTECRGFDIICDDIFFDDYETLKNLLKLYDACLNKNGLLIIQNYLYFGLWQRVVRSCLLKNNAYRAVKLVKTSLVLEKLK